MTMQRNFNWIVLGVIVLMLALVVGLVGAQDSDETDPAAERVGQWVSVACELRPGPQHVTRDITITETDWSAVIVSYADAACTTPFLTLDITGPVIYGEPHPLAQGAVESDFVIETLALTPANEFAVEFLSSAEADTCGSEDWVVGVAQDVTETGCGLVGFAELPSTDHDVTFVRDNYLFAGARPLEGGGFEEPENRPTAIQVPLFRVDGE